MQFKIDKPTINDHRTHFKEVLKDSANNTFDNIYPNRESTEDFITTLKKVSAGQAIPTKILTSFTQVEAIRTAQSTANQTITAANTVKEMKDAYAAFLITLNGI
jgi:hypothetical protein